MNAISLSDPTCDPQETPRALERFFLRYIHDPRDIVFLRLSALLTLTVAASGIVLFVPGVFRWWLGGIHLALVLWFVGPYILMLHNTSHRKLFKAPYRALNNYIPWLLGPFFGETPETYFAHHVGMHHPENNLEADLSSTLPYRRDSVLGFARYFLRFFFAVLFELSVYFVRKKRKQLLVRILVGELGFYAVTAALVAYNWRAAVCVFILPYVFSRFGMMAGNWGQHAFVDKDAPENCYRNSITCINAAYNRRCFNDGYHIGHHVKATRHWTEMPDDFLRNIGTYAKERAIVFSGIDFFGVWFCLMLKRYDWLAKRVVPLGGEKPTMEETMALLKSRTEWTNAA
jgi:hypothetical protein